jgi:hypothetical protein
MEPIFFEKVIIKLLFTNNDLKDKILPFLIKDVFTDFDVIKIIDIIIKYYTDKMIMPSVQDMSLIIDDKKLYESLLVIINIDISQYNNDFLLKKTEEWFRSKLVFNDMANAVKLLNEDKIDEIGSLPDDIRKSLSFNFDVKIGTDLFGDAEKIYESLTAIDEAIRTGVPQLDRLIKGGCHKKTLTLYVAETNLGKTLIMTSSATYNILDNKKVLYITGEMSEHKISERSIANLLDVNINNIDTIGKTSFIERMKNIEKSIKGRIKIKEYPPMGFNAGHIRSLLKELRLRENFMPDILYIDYLDIMAPTFRYKNDSESQVQKRVSEELRAVAVDFDIPTVSASQSNRDGFGASEITLKNTAESIGKAFTSDIIIGATQPPDFENMTPPCFLWKILKNRYGLKHKKLIVEVDTYKMRITGRDDINIKEDTKSVKDGISIIKSTMKNNDSLTEKAFNFD